MLWVAKPRAAKWGVGEGKGVGGEVPKEKTSMACKQDEDTALLPGPSLVSRQQLHCGPERCGRCQMFLNFKGSVTYTVKCMDLKWYPFFLKSLVEHIYQ